MTNFDFAFYRICVQKHIGSMKFCDSSGRLLQVEWNTCLLTNFNIVNIMWKLAEGEKGSIILLFFSFGSAFNVGG